METTGALVGVYLKRFPSGLLLFRAVDCCDHGSALESNRYPLILSGPHEHDSLLPIFFNRPPKGAFLAARSRAPNLFRVSWLHLKFRKFVENVHFGVGFRIQDLNDLFHHKWMHIKISPVSTLFHTVVTVYISSSNHIICSTSYLVSYDLFHRK